MKKISFLTIVLALSFMACKNEKKETVIENVEPQTSEIKEVTPKTLTMALMPKSDSKVNGTIIFTEEFGMVSMNATLTGLESGEHAIHIHESSDCSSPDGKSTGGHWNPTSQQHGKWGDDTGYHKGDIGNFTADENGNGTVAFSTNEWCIGCDDDTKNILGKGIIVHAGVDDFKTQPTGDAGGRISCSGIIE